MFEAFFILNLGTILKKEILILIGLFLFLALGMHHKEWIADPIGHVNNLENAGAYGVGLIHPVVFTFAIYVILWIPRGIVRLFRGKGKGKVNNNQARYEEV